MGRSSEPRSGEESSSSKEERGSSHNQVIVMSVSTGRRVAPDGRPRVRPKLSEPKKPVPPKKIKKKITLDKSTKKKTRSKENRKVKADWETSLETIFEGGSEPTASLPSQEDKQKASSPELARSMAKLSLRSKSAGSRFPLRSHRSSRKAQTAETESSSEAKPKQNRAGGKASSAAAAISTILEQPSEASNKTSKQKDEEEEGEEEDEDEEEDMTPLPLTRKKQVSTEVAKVRAKTVEHGPTSFTQRVAASSRAKTPERVRSPVNSKAKTTERVRSPVDESIASSVSPILTDMEGIPIVESFSSFLSPRSPAADNASYISQQGHEMTLSVAAAVRQGQGESDDDNNKNEKQQAKPKSSESKFFSGFADLDPGWIFPSDFSSFFSGSSVSSTISSITGPESVKMPREEKRKPSHSSKRPVVDTLPDQQKDFVDKADRKARSHPIAATRNSSYDPVRVHSTDFEGNLQSLLQGKPPPPPPRPAKHTRERKSQDPVRVHGFEDSELVVGKGSSLSRTQRRKQQHHHHRGWHHHHQQQD